MQKIKNVRVKSKGKGVSFIFRFFIIAREENEVNLGLSSIGITVEFLLFCVGYCLLDELGYVMLHGELCSLVRVDRMPTAIGSRRHVLPDS